MGGIITIKCSYIICYYYFLSPFFSFSLGPSFQFSTLYTFLKHARTKDKKTNKKHYSQLLFHICFNNFLIIFFTQPTPYSDIHSRVCFTTHNKRFKFTQHVFPLRSINNMSSNNKNMKIHHETLWDGKHTNVAQSTNSKHLYTG